MQTAGGQDRGEEGSEGVIWSRGSKMQWWLGLRLFRGEEETKVGCTWEAETPGWGKDRNQEWLRPLVEVVVAGKEMGTLGQSGRATTAHRALWKSLLSYQFHSHPRAGPRFTGVTVELPSGPRCSGGAFLEVGHCQLVGKIWNSGLLSFDKPCDTLMIDDDNLYHLVHMLRSILWEYRSLKSVRAQEKL